MKKIKYMIPVGVLFGTPWVHKAVYENIVASNIGVGSDSAHVFAGLLSLVAIMISCMIAGGLFD